MVRNINKFDFLSCLSANIAISCRFLQTVCSYRYCYCHPEFPRDMFNVSLKFFGKATRSRLVLRYLLMSRHRELYPQLSVLLCNIHVLLSFEASQSVIVNFKQCDVGKQLQLCYLNLHILEILYTDRIYDRLVQSLPYIFPS